MSSISYRDFTGTSAEAYQRWFVPTIATPVARDLLRTARLRAGERVLDVACGTGVVTRLAAEQVGPTGRVTGIDIASDMIDVARSTPTPTGSQIEWHVGDAAALPFPDRAHDVVLCQMGLMFIEDRRAALAEVHRTLVPDGRVVLNTPGAIQPVFEAMDRGLVEHISPDLGGFVRAVFSLHDPDVVATLLLDAGFRDVTATGSTTTLRLPPPADFLWQYISLTPMAPLVADAPEGDRSALEQQIVEDWQPFVVDGRTVVDQPMVIASGRR